MPGTDADTPAGRGGAWFLFAIFAVLLVFGIVLARSNAGGNSAGPGPSIGGSFELVATDGSRFTEKNLAGKPFAIYFGYTRCPDVCPTSLSKLARLRKQLGADGDKFTIVFVSVDPDRDKPNAIGEYVKLFGTSIVGLTGSEEQLAAVTKNYGIFVNKVPQEGGDYLVDHTASILLMDSNARFFDTIAFDEDEASAFQKLKRLVG